MLSWVWSDQIATYRSTITKHPIWTSWKQVNSLSALRLRLSGVTLALSFPWSCLSAGLCIHSFARINKESTVPGYPDGTHGLLFLRGFRAWWGPSGKAHKSVEKG